MKRQPPFTKPEMVRWLEMRQRSSTERTRFNIGLIIQELKEMQADEQVFLKMKEALNHVNASAQTGHKGDGIGVVISFFALDQVKRALDAIGFHDHLRDGGS